MQQEEKRLQNSNIRLVVVVDQDVTAAQALQALGESTSVPLLMGTNDAYSAYHVAGVPANYLIDPKGRLVTQAAGWLPTLPDRWFQLVDDVGGK